MTKIVICCDQHLVKLRKKEEVVDSKEMQLLAKQKDQVGDKKHEMQVVVCVCVSDHLGVGGRSVEITWLEASQAVQCVVLSSSQ